MITILILAIKELRDGLRNRWVVAITLLLAALALTLSFLGSAPTGTVGAGRLEVTIVGLSSLTIFLLPLIALLLSFDAIVGEIDRGTMTLLLAYPVGRGQVLAGKFLGHAAILSLATVLGYGSAGVALALSGTAAAPGAWAAFAGLIGSSILLGTAFAALGYLISAAVNDRGTAAGIAIGVWLLFVLLYDMALLGLLVADGGRHITPALLNGLLLASPADAYRLLNLAGQGSVSQFSGMAGLASQAHLSPALLLSALTGWTLVPLAGAALLFRRKAI